MRIVYILLINACLFTACSGIDNKSAATGNGKTGEDSLLATSMSWEKQQIDYGKIPEGQKLDVVYHFTNTGDRPLVIKRVEPGCGCTVAETPTEPIAPGKEGTIKGSFDSNGRVGVQHKSISVYSNAKGPNPQELVFTVEVIKK